MLHAECMRIIALLSTFVKLRRKISLKVPTYDLLVTIYVNYKQKSIKIKFTTKKILKYEKVYAIIVEQ